MVHINKDKLVQGLKFRPLDQILKEMIDRHPLPVESDTMFIMPITTSKRYGVFDGTVLLGYKIRVVPDRWFTNPKDAIWFMSDPFKDLE